MDEQEWLRTIDPRSMLELLFAGNGMVKSAAGRRKLRLLLCAFVRSAWPNDRRRLVKACLDLAEQRADGQEDEQAVEQKAQKVISVFFQNLEDKALSSLHGLLAMDGHYRFLVLHETARLIPEVPAARQCGLIRCVFGNPWHPTAIPPAVKKWREGTVVRVAEAIYEKRLWEDLPLLGDALDDAGLEDAAALEHCRRPGPHAKGCFVVDALLGRSWAFSERHKTARGR